MTHDAEASHASCGLGHASGLPCPIPPRKTAAPPLHTTGSSRYLPRITRLGALAEPHQGLHPGAAWRPSGYPRRPAPSFPRAASASAGSTRLTRSPMPPPALSRGARASCRLGAAPASCGQCSPNERYPAIRYRQTHYHLPENGPKEVGNRRKEGGSPPTKQGPHTSGCLLASWEMGPGEPDVHSPPCYEPDLSQLPSAAVHC
jgi:hypothetical protein